MNATSALHGIRVSLAEGLVRRERDLLRVAAGQSHERRLQRVGHTALVETHDEPVAGFLDGLH